MNKYFSASDIDNVLKTAYADVDILKNNKKIEYYNTSNSFDIETTSFYEGDEKRAIMYEWSMCLNGYVIIGRSWAEFINVYYKICDFLSLTKQRRLIIYVHNLAFEFQFIKDRLTWENVFSIKERKPIYALTVDGVEFRCSYLLSGYSLETLSKQLRKYKVEKMVGDLDYSLLRHQKTPLNEKELGYCINDVLVVYNYIREKIERDGNIIKIPLTKTSYVRHFCRENCLFDDKSHIKSGKFYHYRKLMQKLQLDVDTYKQLKRAFQGGFTHANARHSGCVMFNVDSFDFTSAYPSVMCSEQFPMSRAESVNINTMSELRKNLKYYCCLFDVTFFNLDEKVNANEHYLSSSKCVGINVVEDNGRVVCAEKLTTTITEEDFFIIEKFYTWDKMKIANFKRFRKGFLPKDFILSILTLYSDKTTLKGVKDKEDEYVNSKEQLNSCYGMAVTDICRDEITYTKSGWAVNEPDIEKELIKYNNSMNRFLYYPWGVWVTAYCRKNLFTAIYEMGSDYIYADTDSVKVVNAKNHMQYIKLYNENITEKILKVLKYYDIPLELARPKTIKGIEKPLGVWDFETENDIYKRFKTLGAKRYMLEDSDGVSLTVAGLNKKTAIPYLLKKYGDKIFDKFTDKLYIPSKNTLKSKLYDVNGLEIKNPTGKNTHTYVDERIKGVLTDYTGVACEYDELSFIHLEPCDYSLSLSDRYIDYIMGLDEYEK